MFQEDFKGKVILITGAANGIGAATAIKFAELGSILSLLDLKSEQLQEVVEQCHAIGEKFKNPKVHLQTNSSVLMNLSQPYSLVGNVADDSILQEYVENTIKNFGRIDILFNNAGFAVPTSILSTPMDVFDKLFNVHVRAPYNLCRLSVPHLIKTKGCIVNASSAAIYKTINMTIYSACKAAVLQMTKCLADELGSHQVRVLAISPGPIKTNIMKDYGPDGDKILEQFAKLTLARRHGLPSEIANLVVFLTSEKASYINGNDVIIDGGFTAKSNN